MKIKKWIAASALALSMVAPMIASAAYNPATDPGSATSLLGQVGTATGQTAGTQASFAATIGNLIKIILSFLGVLVFIYYFYAGFLWMTSGGESKKVESAKTMIKNATIGLLIILSAYTLATYVVSQLVAATTS